MKPFLSSRKNNFKARSGQTFRGIRIRFNIDLPLMHLNNSIGGRKSKTRTMSDSLCGKEWFKDLGFILFFNSRSGILYSN